MEQMRIAKEKSAEPEAAPTHQNGDSAEGAETQPGADETSTASSTTAVSLADTETAESDEAVEKRRGIPSNVKLFEIFHEQVQTNTGVLTRHHRVTGIAREPCFVGTASTLTC